MTVWLQALVKMSRIASNMKDEEGLELIDTILMDTDSPGFRALNPNFGGRPGYGMRLEWPRWGWGSYLAWVMMNLAESLGCGISLGDLRAIHEVRLHHPASPGSRMVLHRCMLSNKPPEQEVCAVVQPCDPFCCSALGAGACAAMEPTGHL